MRSFFDSSAFAKRFIEESGSDDVEKICGESESIGLSSLCLPVIISALNRRVREKSISRKSYSLIKERLIEEIEDAEIINVIPEIIAKAITLLEKNNLRTIDAIHLASAILWETDLFVSADIKQTSVAIKSGLNVKIV